MLPTYRNGDKDNVLVSQQLPLDVGSADVAGAFRRLDLSIKRRPRLRVHLGHHLALLDKCVCVWWRNVFAPLELVLKEFIVFKGI